MDLCCRDLETLKSCISYVESRLREGSPKRDDEDDSSHEDAEAEMPPEAGAMDAPPKNAPAPVPALLLGRILPWKSMRGPVAHLPPVPSPETMMTSSPAMLLWERRRTWPISPSHPQVDRRQRERKPHELRCLPLQRKFNFRNHRRS